MAATETTRLLLEVIGRDHGAKRTLDRVADSAEGASDSVADLSDQVDRSGDKFDEHTKSAKTLDSEIVRVKGSIVDLAREIEKSPDNIPLFRQLSKEQAGLRRLERAKGILASLLPDEKDGEKSGEAVSVGFGKRMVANAGKLGERIATSAVQRIPSAIGGAMSALPPQAQAAIVGGIVAAIVAGGAFIAAAVGAAVTAGMGAATMAGGLVLAAKDSRVKAAAGDLGRTVMRELTAAAGVFVGPALRSIEIVKKGWKSIAPDVAEAFSAMAPYVDNLVRGLVAFARNAMPGVVTAIKRAGPLIDALANGMSMLGVAVGGFFKDISSDSAGSRQALTDLFVLISATIRITGKLVSWLTHLYKGASFVAKALSGDIKGAVASLASSQVQAKDSNDEYAKELGNIRSEAEALAPKLTSAGNQVGTLAAALEPSIERTDIMKMSMMGAAQAAGSLAQALRVVNGDALDARAAEADFEEALDNATDALRENGRTLDLTTEKGRANDAALRALIDATTAKADADYRAAASAGDLAGAQRAATADLETGRKKFIDLAVQMGMSRVEAKRLADQIFKLPKSYTTVVSVQTSAAQKAIAKVQQSLGKFKDLHIGVYFDVKGNLKVPGGTLIKGASTGGPIEGPGPKGRDSELRMLAPGEHVLTASDVDAMGGQAAVTQFRTALHAPARASSTPVHGENLPRGVPQDGAPVVVENHIEIGGEVVRVVRTLLSEHDRQIVRRVQAGAGRR